MEEDEEEDKQVEKLLKEMGGNSKELLSRLDEAFVKDFDGADEDRAKFEILKLWSDPMTDEKTD